MTNVDGIRTAPERVRPSYHPVLHAHIRLIEDGKAPTCVNLAKELGISKQAVSQMLQRHPDLRAWISRQVDAAAGHYVGSVLHRHALLGIQGSVESAKLYLAAMGVKGFSRERIPGQDDEDSPEDSRYVTHVNILVPCPQLPNGGRMPPLGPQPAIGLPAGVDLKDIPTVSVR